MTSSYLKIKKLVADEDADDFVGEEDEEEEEEEEEEYILEGGERARSVEVTFAESQLKKKKLSGAGERSKAEVEAVAVAVAVAVAGPCCLVENCEADLSGCKKYHQRHRVCEVHAKAPVVLVDGLRQRFCQQCSRFHELSEFDQSKRSCRRRLAGHNERRRKSSLESRREAAGTGSSRRPKEVKTGTSGSFINEGGATEMGSPGNQNLHIV